MAEQPTPIMHAWERFMRDCGRPGAKPSDFDPAWRTVFFAGYTLGLTEAATVDLAAAWQELEAEAAREREETRADG